MGGVVRVRCEAIINTLWGESTEGIFPGVGRFGWGAFHLICTFTFSELGEKALERILAGSAIGILENKIYFAILATLLFCHNLL